MASITLILFLTNFLFIVNAVKDVPCGQGKICLRDYVESKFDPKSFNGSWLSDNEIFFIDDDFNFVILDVRTRERTILIGEESLKMFKNKLKLLYTPRDVIGLQTRFPMQDEEEESGGIAAEHFTLSKDRKFLLFSNNFEPKKGSIRYGEYYIFSIDEASTIQIIPPEGQNVKLQYATWGAVGSQLLYIHDFSVYYAPTIDLINEPIKILNGSAHDQIYHLLPDWIYPEAEAPIYEFTDDGKRLLAVSYDNSKVLDFSYDYYGQLTNDTTNQYTERVSIKFPKPGTPIASTNISLFEFDDKTGFKSFVVPHSKRFGVENVYLNAAEWLDNKTIVVSWLSRTWNETNFEICRENISEAQYECEEIYYYQTQSGWIEMVPELVDTDVILIRLPIKSKKNELLYNHVVKIDVNTKKVTQLSSGDYQVHQLLAYLTTELYFIGSTSNNSRHRHLYRTVYDDTSYNTTCITCQHEFCCVNNEISFSHLASYYVHTCKGPEVPRITVRSRDNHQVLIHWEDNNELAYNLTQVSLPITKTYRIPLAGPHHATVRLYLPPNIRLDGSRKLPLVIYVYGGPSEQIVTEDFEIGFAAYMAGSRNVVYAKIDVRGGGGESLNKTFEMHNKIGTVEILDFLKVTKFLTRSERYIDPQRIAIWGWSYGGYATLRTLILDHENLINFGVAVAPVTSWLNYHAGYVERLIGVPEENIEYYRESDVLNHVSQLKNKSLLLVHGTNDDNVHFQHSALLMKALSAENILYQSQIYPDEDHNIHHFYAHLFRTIDAFLYNQLKLD